MKLSISVIIPTFNEEKYLPKLLKSIQRQTIQPKEVIVSDAFSVDRTREIAREFGCTVVDGGMPAKGRNNGARAATQPILLFLDADVVLPPKFLEKAVNEMLDRKLDLTSCYTKAIPSTRTDEMLHYIVNSYMKLTKNFYPHVGGFCIFTKKSVHESLNGFDETLFLGEDHDYFQRAKKKHFSFDYLICYKVPVSTRRQLEEGHLQLTLKYIAMELHLIFLGKIKNDIFRYKFGQHAIDIERTQTKKDASKQTLREVMKEIFDSKLLSEQYYDSLVNLYAKNELKKAKKKLLTVAKVIGKQIQIS